MGLNADVRQGILVTFVIKVCVFIVSLYSQPSDAKQPLLCIEYIV